MLWKKKKNKRDVSQGDRWELFCLEAVDFELLLLDKPHLSQELADILTLITLHLEHFPVFWMLHHSPVASKFLLASLHNLPQIIPIRHRDQTPYRVIKAFSMVAS